MVQPQSSAAKRKHDDDDERGEGASESAKKAPKVL